MAEEIRREAEAKSEERQYGLCIERKCTSFEFMKKQCSHYHDGRCHAITQEPVRTDLGVLYDLGKLVLD